MAVMRVNPTRIELSSLKKRLKTATQGHKLLKDKRDEMMRRFVEVVRQNRQLRIEVEAELESALADFVMARASMDTAALETAILMPTRQIGIEVHRRNVMSVNVPELEMVEEHHDDTSSYPYGLLGTSGDLDEAIAALDRVLAKLVQLAEVEKTANMLADEIEKTRRRLNALEYVMIPDLQDTIRYITMKLDENERSSLTRLMKVKSMLAERDGV